MKTPRPKPHLLVSSEPLKEGNYYSAPCNAVVWSAAFVGESLLPETGGFVLSREIKQVACRKCLSSVLPKGRYLYLAVDGQLITQID